MAEVRITCIKKDGGNHLNRHEGITSYGWGNPANGKSGESNRSAMVKWIEDGNRAYVQDAYGNKVYCDVRKSASGNKFLQTEADGKYTDNLLSLPECR